MYTTIKLKASKINNIILCCAAAFIFILLYVSPPDCFYTKNNKELHALFLLFWDWKLLKWFRVHVSVQFGRKMAQNRVFSLCFLLDFSFYFFSNATNWKFVSLFKTRKRGPIALNFLTKLSSKCSLRHIIYIKEADPNVYVYFVFATNVW